MAKETVKPTAPVTPAAIMARPAATSNGEIVDTRTGEVVHANATADDDLMDAQTLALLSSGDLMAKLDKAAAAKVDDFRELEKDFWKPGAPGSKDAVLQGVYVGSGKQWRILQHGIALKGQDGKPYVIRFNGGAGLTSQFKQCDSGDIVRVEYLGTKTTKGVGNASGVGQTMGDWKVTKIR